MSNDPAREVELNRLEDQFGVLLRRSRRSMRRFAERVHPEMEASGYPVLTVLTQSAPLRLGDLAEEFGLDKSTMSRHVTSLIQLGLVCREPDPQDGRAFLLRPSEDGRRRLAAVTDARRIEWHGRLDNWTTDELAVFVDGLTRLNADLDRD